MLLRGHPFPILSLVALLCTLYGCGTLGYSPGPEYYAWLEQARIRDSLAGTRNGAFDILRNIYGIGPGGGRGASGYPDAIAFHTLVSQPDATQLFTRLIREGSCAGQLYGLAGLRHLDSALFARELPGFLARTDSVTYHMGCFVWKRSMAQVAMETKEPLPPGARPGLGGEDIYSGAFSGSLITRYKFITQSPMPPE